MPGFHPGMLEFRLLIGDQSRFQTQLSEIDRALRAVFGDGDMELIRQRGTKGLIDPPGALHTARDHRRSGPAVGVGRRAAPGFPREGGICTTAISALSAA